ncbi:MAG TPA: ABC transporter ATP-binding protein [Thermoanaerobaculia bacterium]|jgi:ABC-2 type transport system ATP-binding protein|nr:ABC transporter ATP-binding protein [Thermoanaerobaculia bacterium]
MSDPTTPVIELQGLAVQFGGRPILKGLNASLTGRCIGLLGPNGAGKTTLLHTLLGFHAPTTGTARIFGHDIQTEARLIRGLMGYMPESDSFIAGMTAVRFVRLMGELSGLPSERSLERAHETLFYVGLGEARYRKIDTYSLGMKQLAKLAQALVHGPRLLFLDEPTNGLDPAARERMLRLIRDIRDTGEVNIILSSHLLRDVEECCEEVLVLKQGSIATYCNLEEERRANRKFLEIEVRGGDDASFAAAVEGLGCEMALGNNAGNKQKIKVVLPEGIEVRDLYRLAAERQVQIRRLDYKKDSLQDIFLKAMETEVRENGRV